MITVDWAQVRAGIQAIRFHYELICRGQAPIYSFDRNSWRFPFSDSRSQSSIWLNLANNHFMILCDLVAAVIVDLLKNLYSPDIGDEAG